MPGAAAPDPGEGLRRGAVRRIERLGAILAAALAAVAPGASWAQPPAAQVTIQAVHRSDGSLQSFRVTSPFSLPASQLFALHGSQLGLGPNDEMVRFRGPQPLRSSFVVSRYRQWHRDLPVIGGELTVVERDGGVISGNGRVVSGLTVDVELTGTTLTEARGRALHEAAKAVGGIGPPCGEPLCSRVLVSRNTTWRAIAYRLAWRCAVPRPPFPPAIVDLDVQTGTVLAVDTALSSAWSDGTASGATLYHGPRQFTAQQDDATAQWRLQRTAPTPVVTLDAQGGTDTTAAVDVTSPSNAFLHPDHPEAVSVHWAVQRALAYFADHHGRNGWDDMGGTVNSFVSFGTNQIDGAAYAGNGMLLFEDIAQPAASLDVVGHELTHAVTDSSVNLSLEAEPGALGEAFANIFGILIEIDAGVSTSWLLDENRGLPPIDVGSPKAQSWANTYKGLFWVDPASFADCNVGNDNCEVHINSGPGGRWLYLMVTGGQGHLDDDPNQPQWEVSSPVELAKASTLAFATLVDFLPPTAEYPDARAASELVADLLFGAFSQPAVSNQQAWGAVGVGAIGHTEPATTPSHGAVEVNPWTLDLQWETGIFDQGSWQIEVATDSQLTDVVVAESSQTLAADMTSGLLEDVVLKPKATYYWRVRSDADPAKEWWWEPRGFATDDMVPVLGSPSGGNVYPWKLDFHLSLEPGTRYVDIQVGQSASFADDDLVFPTKSFPVEADVEEPDVVYTLTVPVHSDLVWRARARYDDDGENVSDWSQPVGFTTSMPKATLDAPTGGYHHPWPVSFAWTLPHAAEYDIAVHSLPDPDFEWSHAAGSLTEEAVAINLPGTFWVQQIGYDWTIGATGPPWGSELQPEATQEEAEISDPAIFYIDGNDTLVPLVEPEWKSNLPWCLEVGVPVTFRWEPVDNAVSYLLRVREMHCPLTNPPTPCVPSDVLVHEASTAATVVTLSWGTHGSLSGPTSAGDHIGYAWGVQAYAEGGVPGVAPDREEYYLLPQVPEPLAPAAGDHPDDEPLLFSWSSQHAHGGDYVVSIYEGSSCTGPLHFSTVVEDATNWTRHGGWDPEVSAYSWRVHPFVYDLCGAAAQFWQWSWSDCSDFSLTGPPPAEVPQPADAVECWTTPSELSFVFHYGSSVDAFEIEAFDSDYQGTQSFTQVYGQTVQATDIYHDTTIGACYPTGTYYWAEDGPAAASGAVYRWRVRAVLNGEPSDWSDWVRVYYDIGPPEGYNACPQFQCN